MKKIRVLAISGSLRKDSYNRKALKIAKNIATKLGAEVKEADLKQLNLPIYDGDIEAKGFPQSVKKLKKLVEEADVLLIASPEYNRSISGALKNAIDWLSRSNNSLDNKVVAIFGASTGNFGTLRGQNHLRQILAALNVFILPQPQVFIPLAHEAFSPNGSLKDKKIYKRLDNLIQQTFKFYFINKGGDKDG